ncbi:unnamed protein product, partial [Strongylus vulgaris]
MGTRQDIGDFHFLWLTALFHAADLSFPTGFVTFFRNVVEATRAEVSSALLIQLIDTRPFQNWPGDAMLVLTLLILFCNSVSACYRYPKGQKSPCEDLRCGPGEDCVVSQKDGVLSAQCICPSSCPSYGDS